MNFKSHLSKDIYLINKPFFNTETRTNEFYHYIREPDNSIIVAINQKKFLVVNQKRFPIQRSLLEFPMGYIEKNETPARWRSKRTFGGNRFQIFNKTYKNYVFIC
jgi:hypothetical protein